MLFCVGSSRALALASGCYFRSVHVGMNEVRASQLAQASERVGSLIPASQQG